MARLFPQNFVYRKKGRTPLLFSPLLFPSLFFFFFVFSWFFLCFFVCLLEFLVQSVEDLIDYGSRSVIFRVFVISIFMRQRLEEEPSAAVNHMPTIFEWWLLIAGFWTLTEGKSPSAVEYPDNEMVAAEPW